MHTTAEPGTNSAEQWDSEEWRRRRNVKLLEWFLGDTYAVSCYLMLTSAAELWDDLLDKDREVNASVINDVFSGMFIGVPTNPFYVRYQAYIIGLGVVVENAFQDANIMQNSGDPTERIIAFTLRRLGVEFACLFAYCLGGREHLRKVSLDIRRFFYQEQFHSWEHAHVHLSS